MDATAHGACMTLLTACAVAVCFCAIPGHAQDAQGPGGNQNERIPAGLIFLSDNAYASIPGASSPVMGLLHPKEDLTSEFPPPGNQGTKQGSCAAWALAYALKTYQEHSERRWSIATEDHIFSPSFLYNQLNQTSDCSGGLTFSQVFNLAHASGMSSLKDFAYDPDSCSALPSDAVKKGAESFRIGSYRRVNVQDDTEVKSQIAAGVPVLVGLYVDYTFWKLYRGPRGKQIYDKFNPQQNKGGHAVVVVGYDDTKRAYKVINSWGSDWGDQGYGWIAYDTFHEMVKEGFVIQDDPGHNYSQNNPTTSASQIPAQVTQATSSPNLSQGPTLGMQANLQIHFPIVQPDRPVHDPSGAVFPGLLINVPAQVTNAIGRHIQLVARFVIPNGQMLVANPLERVYRDATGLVAVASPEITITTTPYDLAPFYLPIPYYVITQSANGQLIHQLAVIISVYDNSFLIFQTPPESFSF